METAATSVIATILSFQSSREFIATQILVATLIAVLVFLQYLLWIAEDGVRQTHALWIAVQVQTEENAALVERNKALEADVKDLKSGLMAIEERARSEMGMIRRDETFYRFLQQPQPKFVETLAKPPSDDTSDISTRRPAPTVKPPTSPVNPAGQPTNPVLLTPTAKPASPTPTPKPPARHEPPR